MKRNILITLCLSFVLVILSTFIFLPAGEAQTNILPQLLDIPAPPPPNPQMRNFSGDRPEEFYNPENPPDDYAPLEDLFDYWMAHSIGDSNALKSPVPSKRVIERFLEEADEDSEKLYNALRVAAKNPESADLVKQFYDRISNSEDDTDKYQTGQVKQWLTYNSPYFSDELLEKAQGVKDTEDYIVNQGDLLALAKVDFEKARPLLERMENDSTQPVSQTLARWAFYLNAVKKGNSIEAGNYREDLMKTVEDKNAKPGNRDLAMDAIVDGGDFPGRDDWYFSLLEDETLHDLRVGGQTYTGLTTLIMRSPPDKYVDKMLELLKTNNLKVRSAAVRNLTTVLNTYSDPKIITAMLPWLLNPDWANQTGSERGLLVRALASVEIPESVPGLISILNEKTTVEVDEDNYYYSNSNANMNRAVTNSDTPRRKVKKDVFPYRESAVDALIRQKDIRAAAALREVLPEIQQWKRPDVVKAILVSGGFTIPEQVESVELKAREIKNLQTELAQRQTELDTSMSSNRSMPEIRIANTRAYNSPYYSANSLPIIRRTESETFDPAHIKQMLGEQLLGIEEPGSELVYAVNFRVNAIEKNEPEIAGILRGFMQNWRGAAVNAVLLNNLGEGKPDINEIVKLLGARKEIRETQSGSIFDSRSKGNPIAVGISACLLENEHEYEGILAGKNDETKIAMLGCARLIRAKIPVQTVSPFLKSPNKMLAQSAELYIESEDSAEARQILYAKYPNQAKILGATFFFGEKPLIDVRPELYIKLYGSITGTAEFPPYYYYVLANWKNRQNYERLKKEILSDEKLLGVYAYNKNFVRFYQDKTVFSWEEDEARYFERKLSDSEAGYLKNYLARNNVNDLPPFVSYCGGCEAKELLMLGKSGGRRIFVNANPIPQFFEGLEKMLEDLRKPPAALRYWLEKDIEGAEILFAEKNLEVVTVWKNANDMRVLINDKARREQIDKELDKLTAADEENAGLDYRQISELDNKRRAARAFESYSWHKFAGKKLGDFANQPVEIEIITQSGELGENFKKLDEDFENWSVKSGNIEVKLVGNELFKVIGGKASKIQTGYYGIPVITENGRWAVLTKYLEDEDASGLFKINLQTNKESRIEFKEKYKFIEPVAFLSSVNKILLSAGNQIDYKDDGLKDRRFFLFDVETGIFQKADGEFRPYSQKTFRDFQKTGNSDEIWAALSDEGKNETQVGIYNEKSFIFKSVLSVPQIVFDSMDMWIDEPENKVFIVYNGQLISIPLKKQNDTKTKNETSQN